MSLDDARHVVHATAANFYSVFIKDFMELMMFREMFFTGLKKTFPTVLCRLVLVAVMFTVGKFHCVSAKFQSFLGVRLGSIKDFLVAG